MSRSLNFPDKYYIVWLDKDVRDPQLFLQLKRAFFTHVDPESGDEVSLSDKDIDRSIQADSEVPVNFDSFHFTFRAFVDEASCLNYIDAIQNHRILFIASSILGQSAVKKLLEKYRHSFTNSNTNKPYNSIYIFCTDILRVFDWAFSYVEYVKISDFEKDLLARVIGDLGEEFLDHGQQLIEANQNKRAIERLSWAKSFFIRYTNLMFSSELEQIETITELNISGEQRRARNLPLVSIRQPRSSEKLIQIDQLLDIAEKQMTQQSRNDSDQDDLEMQTISTKIPSPVATHRIIYVRERMETENRYKSAAFSSISGQTDDSSTRSNAQFESEMKECFSNIPGDLEIVYDTHDCLRSIIGNADSKAIFLVMSDFAPMELLQHCYEYKLYHGIIKEIYFLGDVNSWILGYFLRHGFHIHQFNRHNDLLVRLLQDIGKYYLEKGKDCKNSASSSSSVKSALIYFDWAEKMRTRANQLVQKEFKDQLNNIDKYQSKMETLIDQTKSVYDIEQQFKDCQRNEDSDSVVIIFIVGMDVRLIHLLSSIARLVTCTTNDQILSTIDKVKLSAPIIIVSSTPPSDNLLSLHYMLNYYCLLKPARSSHIPTKDSSNVTYITSIDQLMNQLYHKLGQHYRDSAIQVSRKSKDLEKAKRLLNRSTKCYELLKTDTEKTLKRYAEILNKT